MATRYNINDFALANPAYVGATVSFWTVSGGAKTSTLATLYAASTGSTTLANPRTLDSDGKFSVPVYVEVETVATVSGLTVADHDTGIMGLTEAAASASAAAAAASETAAAASAAAALVSENNVASAAFGTVSETFNGGGSEFVIAYDAGTLSNIEVFISGVHQVPTTDFTYNNATRTVTTTSTTPSGTGNVLVQYARLRTSAFFTPGIIDNATAKALTLSGSGANSVTIANSATNPTIGTSAGALAITSAVSVTGGITSTGSIACGDGLTFGWGSGSAVYLAGSVAGNAIGLYTNSVEQVRVTNTASSNRYITLTGSNGGNPTIGTSAGTIALSSGALATSATLGLGYGTGSGGSVTQATSRTTGVTLNTPTGKITMFTAAGSATWQSFTVTNSVVATSDNVVLTVEGGNANIYLTEIIGISAGSFIVGFATTGGTSSDAPRINFAIIKGATS